MKKFSFRYESVLKMRMDREERIKNELAKLITRRQDLIEAIESLEINSKNYDIHIQTVLAEGDTQKERQQFVQGKKYYTNQRNSLKQKLAFVENEIRKTQEKLVEAMKDRKVMDKLKEKAFQDFIDAINEADAKLIEEVVNYSNNKKNGE